MGIVQEIIGNILGWPKLIIADDRVVNNLCNRLQLFVFIIGGSSNFIQFWTYNVSCMQMNAFLLPQNSAQDIGEIFIFPLIYSSSLCWASSCGIFKESVGSYS